MSSLKRSASLYTARAPKQLTTDHHANSPLHTLTRIFGNNATNTLHTGIIESPTLAKLKSASKHDDSLNLSINDCTCPICLEILIEPVQMPCHHELCLPCFKLMTDQTSLLCPICRLRISTWSRNASNSNSLVNEPRWQQIKRKFPNEVRNRIEGKSAQLVADSIEKYNKLGVADETYRTVSTSRTPKIHVAEPGEIRSEYLEYLRREEEKLKEEQESEEKASIELIQKLVLEEDHVPFDTYLNIMNQEENVRPTITAQLRTGNLHTRTSESLATSGYATLRRRPPHMQHASTDEPAAHTLRQSTLNSSTETTTDASRNQHVTPRAVIVANQRRLPNGLFTSASNTIQNTTESGAASTRSSIHASNVVNSRSENTPVISNSDDNHEPKRRGGATGLSRNVSITAASLRKRPQLDSGADQPSTSSRADFLEGSATSTLRRTGTMTLRVRPPRLDMTADMMRVMNDTCDNSFGSQGGVDSDNDTSTLNGTRTLRRRRSRLLRR